MKKIILSITLAAMATLCLTNCGKRQQTAQTAKVIPVKVMSIAFSDNAQSRNYVGTVEESTAISLGFPGMGTVERVLVSEGERVKKGQLLAVLDSHAVRNAYEVTKSTLYQAQDAYDRLKPLHEKESITNIKWIEVESGLDKAKAMEAVARKSVDDCSLFAPMSGIVAKRSVEEGVNVMPGVSAFKIVSIDQVYINVPVPENEIGSIPTGKPATVIVPAIGNREYQGIVDKKGVEANPISRTYALKIKVNNPALELMPGMVCKVYLQNGNNREIIIPNRAVQISHDNRQFVWLADGDTAHRQFITVGSLSNFGVTVESGLSDGDKLITEGYQKVSEGMKINILN